MNTNKKPDVHAFYMLSAYSQNLMDLIDVMKQERNPYFIQEIKRACNMFYKSVGNNKVLNHLLEEIFTVDSMEYNQYRDAVDKTVHAVLNCNPREWVRLKYAQKVIEDDGAILFTEKEMMEFAIKFRAEGSLNVKNDLNQYIEDNNEFKQSA